MKIVDVEVVYSHQKFPIGIDIHQRAQWLFVPTEKIPDLIAEIQAAYEKLTTKIDEGLSDTK